IPLPACEVADSVLPGARLSGPVTVALMVRIVVPLSPPHVKVDVAVKTPGVAVDSVTLYVPVLGATLIVKGAPGAVNVQATAAPVEFWVDTVIAAGGAQLTATGPDGVTPGGPQQTR